MPSHEDSVRFDDIFVAVHGIGDQFRFSTIRSVATQLARIAHLTKNAPHPPVAPQPLGYFHGNQGGTDVHPVILADDGATLTGSCLGTVGFAEVYWADLPQEYVSEAHTLEETKAWAATVVARAQALCDRAAKESNTIVTPDFTLAGEVLEEIIDTVRVLENLTLIGDKLGVFKFDLREVLEAYLGDVQVVAEFGRRRLEILSRFHRALESIYSTHIAPRITAGDADLPRIHLIAHSEGTVVAFLGLLHAMSGHRIVGGQREETGQPPAWLSHVHSLMTIGSPIDKHLLLWPRLWSDLHPEDANALFTPASATSGANDADASASPDRRIKWRNYYDYGDPVGFELDTARQWLRNVGCRAFEFEKHHDFGFARYLLPGKAHNDYWDDEEVFSHFVVDAAGLPRGAPPAPAPAAPKSRPSTLALSPVIPYLLSFVLLFAGTFLMVRFVTHYCYPVHDAANEQRLLELLNLRRDQPAGGLTLFYNVFGMTMLIAGTTLIARLPRLVAGAKAIAIGAGGFALGALGYWLLVAPTSRALIGAVFEQRLGLNSTIGVIAGAALTGVIGLSAKISPRANKSRQQRWILKGMRPLLAVGTLLVALLVASQTNPMWFGHDHATALHGLPFTDAATRSEELRPGLVRRARLSPGELEQLFAPVGSPVTGFATAAEYNQSRWNDLVKAGPLLEDRPSIWPVIVSIVVFFYLWWLSTLLFDLSAVWHRYVRRSVAETRLRSWLPDEESFSRYFHRD